MAIVRDDLGFLAVNPLRIGDQLTILIDVNTSPFIRLHLFVALADPVIAVAPGQPLPGPVKAHIAPIQILAEHRVRIALDQIVTKLDLIRQLSRHMLGNRGSLAPGAHQRPRQAKQHQRTGQPASQNPVGPAALKQAIERGGGFEYQSPKLPAQQY